MPCLHVHTCMFPCLRWHGQLYMYCNTDDVYDKSSPFPPLLLPFPPLLLPFPLPLSHLFLSLFPTLSSLLPPSLPPSPPLPLTSLPSLFSSFSHTHKVNSSVSVTFPSPKVTLPHWDLRQWQMLWVLAPTSVNHMLPRLALCFTTIRWLHVHVRVRSACESTLHDVQCISHIYYCVVWGDFYRPSTFILVAASKKPYSWT